MAIAAAQSATCTFSSAGKFKFSDAASAKKAFRGTVTVTQPLVSSFSVTPKAVVYGGKSTLSGKLASGQSGQAVKVQAQACGAAKPTVVATVTTTTGGAFTYQAQPLKKTTYTLSNKGLTAGAAINVAPSLQLSKVTRHHYQLQVSAAQSFVGKLATFQRYRPKVKRWVKVKRVTLVARGRDGSDRDELGDVPFGHQGAPEGARQSRSEAGRLLLPRRREQHDPQLTKRVRRAGFARLSCA